MKIQTVFLDRDGVLNEDKEDKDEYLRSEEEIIVYPFVPEAIRKLTEKGIRIFIISNQSGINRRFFDEKTVEKMFQKVITYTESTGGKITDYYYCPHLPEEECSCRKPKTGMLQKAVKEYQLSLKESIMIGDALTDYEMANNAGIPFILVRTGKGKRTEEKLKEKGAKFMVVDNLESAVSFLVKDIP
ncbi:MAG: HAD family hydrolase [Candidatus Marinimicrobia bacterium]|nr:HAD family hydrolase [Candidatus Neomarinimicrobiota bacterium]MDD5581682.1 HAD family hydrolase [Candidatus Neomarinimicrobiota bacterium]